MRSSPTTARRWLAANLRTAREQAGLPQHDVAKTLGCGEAKISLLENGQRRVQAEDLKRLLFLYLVPDEDHPLFIEAAKRSRQKGWWEAWGDKTIARPLRQYIGLEQGAETVRTYNPAVVSGLLQTRDYAKAIMRQGDPGTDQAQLDKAVAMRLRRQRVLHEAEPLRLHAILDEAAIRRVVGGPSTMAQQLNHLAALGRNHEHVTVQVLPFVRDGAFAATEGVFTILDFAWRDDPGMIHFEYAHGAVFLDSSADVDHYTRRFEALQRLALSPIESIDLCSSVAADLLTSPRAEPGQRVG